MFEGQSIDYQGGLNCDVCGGPRLPKFDDNVLWAVVDGGLVSGCLCDDCRRKICTCSTCAGYAEDDEGYGQCRMAAPRAVKDADYDDWLDDWAPVDEDEGCLLGWRQARPMTTEEIEERLVDRFELDGSDLVDGAP